VLLSPDSIFFFHYIIKVKSETDTVPITHLDGYKHVNLVDYLNLYGYGNNAVLSSSGVDRSHVVLINRDLYNYFYKHYEDLRDR
jgi:hypothetical protein